MDEVILSPRRISTQSSPKPSFVLTIKRNAILPFRDISQEREDTENHKTQQSQEIFKQASSSSDRHQLDFLHQRQQYPTFQDNSQEDFSSVKQPLEVEGPLANHIRQYQSLDPSNVPSEIAFFPAVSENQNMKQMLIELTPPPQAKIGPTNENDSEYEKEDLFKSGRCSSTYAENNSPNIFHGQKTNFYEELKRKERQEEREKARETRKNRRLSNLKEQTQGLQSSHSKLQKRLGTIKQIKQEKSSFPNPSFVSQVKQLNIIRRFQSKMKERITRNDVQSLSMFQLSLIHDTSHHVQTAQHHRTITFYEFFHKIRSLFFNLVTRRTLSPDSTFFILWKGLLVAIYLLTILDVPLQFLSAYSDNSSLQLAICLFYIPMWIFILEIFLNFNTGFYREGQIVEEKEQIFNNYIEIQFWLDLLSVCGFAVSQMFPFAKALFLVRIYNLFLQLRQFEDRAQFTQQFPSLWTLLKLFMLIFCVAHFCGCGFAIIAYVESGKTWLDKYNIINDGWQTHYIFSLYFSFITMITVGYGDIVPQTNIEKLYVIFMTLISAATFGYSLNTIGAIFQDIAAKSVNYRTQKRDIGQYMRCRNIDSKLQVKVFQYLSYIHLDSQVSSQTDEVLNKLSNELRLQVKKDYFGKTLHSSMFLTSNFSADLINSLTLKMKEQFFRKGEFVFQKNDTDQRLLILTRGQAELTIGHPTLQDISLCKFDKGDIGSKGFLTGLPREVSLRVLSNNCTFAYVSNQEFMEILKYFPQDYVNHTNNLEKMTIIEQFFGVLFVVFMTKKERFCLLRDQILYYSQNQNQQKQLCFSCKKFGHGIINCPNIHLQKSNDLIISRFLYCPQQIRSNWKRCRKVKQKSLKQLDKIKEELKNYRIDVMQILRQNDEYIELLDEDTKKRNDRDFILATDGFRFNQENDLYTLQSDVDSPFFREEDEEDYDEDDLEENQEFQEDQELNNVEGEEEDDCSEEEDEEEEDNDEKKQQIYKKIGQGTERNSCLSQHQKEEGVVRDSNELSEISRSYKKLKPIIVNRTTDQGEKKEDDSAIKSLNDPDKKQFNQQLKLSKNELNVGQHASFLQESPLKTSSNAKKRMTSFASTQFIPHSNRLLRSKTPNLLKSSYQQRNSIFHCEDSSGISDKQLFVFPNQIKNCHNLPRQSIEQHSKLWTSLMKAKSSPGNTERQQQHIAQQISKARKNLLDLKRKSDHFSIYQPSNRTILPEYLPDKQNLNSQRRDTILDAMDASLCYTNYQVMLDICILDFDKVQEYLIYFPSGNYTTVVKNAKYKILKKQNQLLGAKSNNRTPSNLKNRQQQHILSPYHSFSIRKQG